MAEDNTFVTKEGLTYYTEKVKVKLGEKSKVVGYTTAQTGDELKAIKIDDTIYNIPSGGSGGMTIKTATAVYNADNKASVFDIALTDTEKADFVAGKLGLKVTVNSSDDPPVVLSTFAVTGAQSTTTDRGTYFTFVTSSHDLTEASSDKEVWIYQGGPHKTDPSLTTFIGKKYDPLASLNIPVFVFNADVEPTEVDSTTMVGTIYDAYGSIESASEMYNLISAGRAIVYTNYYHEGDNYGMTFSTFNHTRDSVVGTALIGRSYGLDPGTSDKYYNYVASLSVVTEEGVEKLKIQYLKDVATGGGVGSLTVKVTMQDAQGKQFAGSLTDEQVDILADTPNCSIMMDLVANISGTEVPLYTAKGITQINTYDRSHPGVIESISALVTTVAIDLTPPQTISYMAIFDIQNKTVEVDYFDTDFIKTHELSLTQTAVGAEEYTGTVDLDGRTAGRVFSDLIDGDIFLRGASNFKAQGGTPEAPTVVVKSEWEFVFYNFSKVFDPDANVVKIASVIRSREIDASDAETFYQLVAVRDNEDTPTAINVTVKRISYVDMNTFDSALANKFNASEVQLYSGDDGKVLFYNSELKIAASDVLNTELLMLDGINTTAGSIETRLTNITNDIGSDTATTTIKGRIKANEDAIALKADASAIPTIKLNGTPTTAPDFYAPTTIGTAGQFFGSDGTTTGWQSISSALKFAGADTKANILAKTGMAIGDVWSATDEDYENYAYNGTAWIDIGKTVDLSAYQPKLVGTANMVLVSDASGYISVSSVNATKLGYISGLTSDAQTQLDAKQKKISYGTGEPSGGSPGDIYIKYS